LPAYGRQNRNGSTPPRDPPGTDRGRKITSAMEISEAVGEKSSAPIPCRSISIWISARTNLPLRTGEGPAPFDRSRFPGSAFSCGPLSKPGRKTVDQLHGDGKPICVAGGTGLYIKTLTRGLFPSPPVDPKVRERLKRRERRKGVKFFINA